MYQIGISSSQIKDCQRESCNSWIYLENINGCSVCHSHRAMLDLHAAGSFSSMQQTEIFWVDIQTQAAYDSRPHCSSCCTIQVFYLHVKQCPSMGRVLDVHYWGRQLGCHPLLRKQSWKGVLNKSSRWMADTSQCSSSCLSEATCAASSPHHPNTQPSHTLTYWVWRGWYSPLLQGDHNAYHGRKATFSLHRKCSQGIY